MSIKEQQIKVGIEDVALWNHNSLKIHNDDITLELPLRTGGYNFWLEKR